MRLPRTLRALAMTREDFWEADSSGMKAKKRQRYDLIESYNIRTVEKLSGHRDAGTTMIYTYALNRGNRGIRGPVDAPAGP